MIITSTDNNKIKLINKLKQKKYRDIENKFVIETENLIKEALENSMLLEIYILTGETLPFKVNVPIYEVTNEVMNKIKNINTSKVIGICRKKSNNNYQGTKYLMLDGVQDPGNLGTIIRSAVAFNIDTIILSNTCCDLYNDKTVRATEGAIFKANIIRRDLKESIDYLNNLKIKIYGTDVKCGKEVKTIEKDNYCIIIGSEGNGISQEIKEKIKENIYIKIHNVESLNVAIVTSIILYELNRN